MNVQRKRCLGCEEMFERPYGSSDPKWEGRKFCSARCAVRRVHGQGAVANNGSKPPEEAAAVSSRNLLRALLNYGINHDSDLGMGAQAFYARCAEVGIAA